MSALARRPPTKKRRLGDAADANQDGRVTRSEAAAYKNARLHHARRVGLTATRQPARSATAGPKPDTTKPSVGIIGAGMAGLYAGMLLDSLDIDYEILEGAETAGGRIRTHFFPKGDQGEFNYIDVGAMRFPEIDIMDRVIGAQKWSLVSKINSYKDQKEEDKVTLTDYVLSNENQLNMFNGIRKTQKEVEADLAFNDLPETQDCDKIDTFEWAKTGLVRKEYAVKGAQYWWDEVFRPYVEAMADDFDTGFEKLQELDELSVRDALLLYYTKKKNYGTPQETDDLVTWMETMLSSTNLYYHYSATENVIDAVDFEAEKWCLSKGGMSQFTKGMLAMVKAPLTGHGVEKIAPDQFGKLLEVTGNFNKSAFKKSYTHVISTVTNAAFNLIDTDACKLGAAKRTAVRCLKYDHSVKVCLKFKTRWWETRSEDNPNDPIYGGVSSTDLPIRTVVYPSYGSSKNSDPGVLIVSYTWGRDAEALGNLDDARACSVSLSNLATLHNVKREFLEDNLQDTFVMNWQTDPFAQGPYALFGPGQFNAQFKHLIEPAADGRLLFAGEAASVHHAWIIGSLNSAYRTVYEILDKENMHLKKAELLAKWGKCEEVDFAL